MPYFPNTLARLPVIWVITAVSVVVDRGLVLACRLAWRRFFKCPTPYPRQLKCVYGLWHKTGGAGRGWYFCQCSSARLDGLKSVRSDGKLYW